MPEDVFHEDMFSIVGGKASTRPRTVGGSKIEVRLEEEDSAVMPNTPRPNCNSSTISSSSLSSTRRKGQQAPSTVQRARPTAFSEETDDLDEEFLRAEPVLREHSLIDNDSGDDVEPAAPKPKKKKIQPSRSRSSEVIQWASSYQKSREEQETKKLEILERQHKEKLDMFAHLCAALEKK